MRLAFLLLLAACPNTHYDFDYKSEPNACSKELVLGVGDVITINVWEQKDLNVADATLRPDGTITMPLVGDIHAAGMTPTQLRIKISESLVKYVKLQGSEVTVAVKAWKSYRFTVNGEVAKPGVYSSDQCIRVADALALSGGLTRFARRGGVVLMRADAAGKTRHIPLDYDALASGKREDMNIWIIAGDVIWVP
jgi:polysaccharide export outer membrane protein